LTDSTIAASKLAIANASCHSGNAPLVSLAAASGSCVQAAAPTAAFSGNELIVLFALPDGCAMGGAPPGALTASQLALAVALPIVGAILIAGAILFAVPATRRKLFPFAFRRYHEFQTNARELQSSSRSSVSMKRRSSEW